MRKVMNADTFYDVLTAAKIAAEQDDDAESASEIGAALDALQPFAAGYICTALAEADAEPSGLPAPKCEECGNDGSMGSLYETIDAKWDSDLKGWVLEQREDDGGSEIDCLNCDHRTESDGVFPYGAVVR